MALTYRIDSDAGLLIVEGDAEPITQADRMAAIRAWMGDPAYRPGLDTLFDVSPCPTTPDLTQLQEIATFIDKRAASVGRKKLAIVAATPFVFGVARQFQALADAGPITVNVCTSRRQAMEWLRPATET